jgi:hypothetical protein
MTNRDASGCRGALRARHPNPLSISSASSYAFRDTTHWEDLRVARCDASAITFDAVVTEIA